MAEAAAAEQAARETAAKEAAAAQEAAATEAAAASKAAIKDVAVKEAAVAEEASAREAAMPEAAAKVVAARAAAKAAAAVEPLAEAAPEPTPERPAVAGPELRRRAGAKVDTVAPLAVLAHGKNGGPIAAVAAAPEPLASGDIVGPDGTSPLRAPLQGTVVSLSVRPGDSVRAGQPVAIMESMKMEHVIAAHVSGYVREFTVAAGDTVFENHPLAFIEEAEIGESGAGETEEVDLDYIRPDRVHVLAGGRIVASGGPELAHELEREGYDKYAAVPA